MFERLDESRQSPDTLVITCDNRQVNPNQIFSTDSGTLFVVRNIDEFSPPYEIGTVTLLYFFELLQQRFETLP